MQKKSKSGFTLIEILISLGIFAILFAIGLPLSLDSYRNYILNSETSNLVTLIRRAESLALSNVHNSSHGIYIEEDRIILFEGESYAARNTAFDEEFERAEVVSISGPTEIVFSALESKPNAAVSFVLSNLLNVHRVDVNEHGAIFW